jgi:hypothetical protein
MSLPINSATARTCMQQALRSCDRWMNARAALRRLLVALQNRIKSTHSNFVPRHPFASGLLGTDLITSFHRKATDMQHRRAAPRRERRRARRNACLERRRVL